MLRARNRRVLAGGCLAALSVLAAGPAVADDAVVPVANGASALPTPSPSATSSPPSSPPSLTATTASETSLSRASAYVVAALTDGTHVVGPYGPDLGQSADVALGLASTADHGATLGAVVTYLKQNSAGYVHGDPALGEKVDANYAGVTGKLALVAQVTGNDPTSFGGIDLVSELRGVLVTTGKDAGRFSDDSAFGDFSNPLSQSFVVLALERATIAGAPRVAVNYLVAAQCTDGGFPEAFGAKTCMSSPAATGLALQALVAAGADCPAARAQAWLTSHQGADGSFASFALEPTTPPAANVNSTAYAALGLSAARQSTATSLAYLTSMQNADGGLPPVPSSSTASDPFATAQALVALAQASFLTVGPLPLAARIPTCVTATTARTQGASPTVTKAPALAPTSKTKSATRSAIKDAGAPAAATSTDSTAASPASSRTPSSAAPTRRADVLDTSTANDPAALPDSSALRAATGDLPQTGADLLTPVAVGLVLLMVGLTLLFATRRRHGRHV